MNELLGASEEIPASHALQKDITIADMRGFCKRRSYFVERIFGLELVLDVWRGLRLSFSQ